MTKRKDEKRPNRLALTISQAAWDEYERLRKMLDEQEEQAKRERENMKKKNQKKEIITISEERIMACEILSRLLKGEKLPQPAHLMREIAYIMKMRPVNAALKSRLRDATSDEDLTLKTMLQNYVVPVAKPATHQRLIKRFIEIANNKDKEGESDEECQEST